METIGTVTLKNIIQITLIRKKVNMLGKYGNMTKTNLN